MKLLAIDTSGVSLSVCITEDLLIRYECTLYSGRTHSEYLMPEINKALETCKLDISDIDAFAAVSGPGSFTGVRIGVATIKALAQATQKPCIGINALEALAKCAAPFEGIICPMQDARASQVYCAAYKEDKQILPDEAMQLDAFLAAVSSYERCCFVGDGAHAHHARILEALGQRAVILPPERSMLRASYAALLAYAKKESMHGFHALLPYYLRAPQAERERLAKEATKP